MKTLVKSIVLGLTVLAIGVVCMRALAGMRRDPAISPLPEDVLRVNAVSLESESVQVTINGLGEARPLDVVAIAPEVSGTVVEVHPNLDVGSIIPKGETIFAIDPRTFTARRNEAAAQVDQWTSQVDRQETQYTIDRKRLDTLKRSRTLAQAEFDRRKALFDTDDVGSQSNVDIQEQAYNAAIDAADQLGQVVEVYPMRIAEAEAALDSARARLEIAEIDLDRTRVVAPFTARVVAQAVEIGQYVSPGGFARGQELVTLANDAVLEIFVPVSSLEVRNWIQFTDESTSDASAWFNKVKPVECEVRWTEDVVSDHCWNGVLHRVGKFDQMSRQVFMVVRVAAHEAAPTGASGLPLVAGMFCKIRIPGRPAEDVYRVPDGLVSHENTIYMVVDGRLRTAPIEVVHREGDEILIRGDFDPGALVITTRLTNPLENILLDVIRDDEGVAE